jgi:hypothetical protein
MSAVLYLLAGFVIAPATVLAWMPAMRWLYRLLLPPWRHYGIRQFIADWLGTAVIQAVIWEFGLRVLPASAGAGISAAVAAAAWWYRRRRRRGLAALGAKARARIAAMTARMRERPARPALRPVPAGAR